VEVLSIVRLVHLLLLGCVLWSSLGTAHAQQTLYAGTSIGNLYTIDPTTANATLVAPVLVGALPISLTGLDFDPLTQVLYGVTSDSSPNFPDYLITINPTSGAAIAVGPLGQILTDIAFNSAGMLFGWVGQSTGNNLVSINLTTGAATIVGPSPSPPGPYVNDGGLAFSPGGTLYLVSNDLTDFPNPAIVATVNPATGIVTYGPTIAPDDRDINAMKFNAAGTLFASAVDSDGYSTLYTIDPTTGAINFIGPLPAITGFPEHTDALAFTPVVPPAPTFLIRYFTNLTTLGDSFVNLTNTGANATSTGNGINFSGGTVCANVYVFDPNEEELDCCSCQITPNALQSTTVTALVSNNLTPEKPNSVVVKLVATGLTGATCDPTTAGSMANPIVPGLVAWGTTLHQSGAITFGTETEFSRATLSQGELNRLTNLCTVIKANGSSFGLCKGCNAGGF
jgi:hypothetical protein